jgi:hypothetical protein
MTRWIVPANLIGSTLISLAGALPAWALDRAVPNLDYVSTCKATPPVAMDQKQTYESCINDEKQAKKDLPAQWNRSKAEWRQSCLTETTLGGLASYVELLTCLEMHDPNPPSLQRSGASLGTVTPPAGGVTPDVGSPLQRNTMPK